MGILSSIFRHKHKIVTSDNSVDDNPWVGLFSYEDPEEVEREGRKPKQFRGRDEESHSVAQLIIGNIFVTLYGKSGTGKTSLLNAGVFPLLRQKRFLPVSIRLEMDARNGSFLQCIIDKLVKAVTDHQGSQETINVVEKPEDEQQPDYLWSYFARTRFVNSEGQTVFPVLVFDQFDEIFRDRIPEAEVLLRQIAYLMDESHALSPRLVDGKPYTYDFNFRFVTSIREDELYRLEDSIDNCYLPALKRCRYRLRGLKKPGAKDVILVPGEGLFKAGEQEDIAKTIIDKSRNKDETYNPNIVSLLCSRIYVDYLRSGADQITQSLVDSFIKGNPFEQFYNEATRGFSNKEKRYIENHLVDSSGRRNFVSQSDFLKRVKNGAVLWEGSRKILQRTSTSSDGGNYSIELIHDSFCEPLKGLKEKREKRKRLKQMGVIALIAIFSIFSATYVWSINHKMRLNESRVLAEKASHLVDDEDPYTAQLLVLEALPPNRPYTAEAEMALRKAFYANMAILKGHTSSVLKGHTGSVESVSFSPDGKRIISASKDKSICILDAQTGQCLQILKGHTDYVNSASFSPDGRRIVSASGDGTVRIWEFPPLQELINQTRERFKNRKLTPEERRKYYLE